MVVGLILRRFVGYGLVLVIEVLIGSTGYLVWQIIKLTLKLGG